MCVFKTQEITEKTTYRDKLFKQRLLAKTQISDFPFLSILYIYIKHIQAFHKYLKANLLCRT